MMLAATGFAEQARSTSRIRHSACRSNTLRLLIALVALGLVACAPPAGQTSGPGNPASDNHLTDNHVINTLDDGAIEMVPVSFDEWQGIRATHKPAILVVDLWASWCVPCLERFPEMIRMSREYQQHGVQFLSLSLDDRDDPDGIAFANKFLLKNKPPFANYFLDEDILDGFEKLGILGVPAVDIYGRDGQRAYRLTGDNPNAQFTEKDVENAIATLLRQ